MARLPLLLVCVLGAVMLLPAQSDEYQAKKMQQLAAPSVFQDYIDGKTPDRVLYRDDDVTAFYSISPQLPVHIIIIPNKRIPTLNDAGDADAAILAKMLLTARNLARQLGIAESGYRLAINTNEDAGQSVFHLHLHVLGGHGTGAMVDQTWRNRNGKPGASRNKDIEDIRHAFGAYFQAWLQNDSEAVMALLDEEAVIIPDGLPPLRGKSDIRHFWFPGDGSSTIITKFDFECTALQADLHTAVVEGRSTLSFRYEKNGQVLERNDQKQVHLTFLKRQDDGRWLVVYKMWSNVNE